MKKFLPNDPKEMAKAADASWLCDEFQKSSLSLEEKQHIIRSVIADYKKEKANG